MSSAASPRPTSICYAAEQLGVPIADCVIIEDSPVGAKGALASGARVIGLLAGAHCLRPAMPSCLRPPASSEIARSFDEVRAAARPLG